MNNIYNVTTAIQLLKNKGIIREDSSFVSATSGIVHDVYQVISGKEIFYLKIRLDHFKTDKKIMIKPEEINHEKKVIQAFRNCCPEFVPELIYSHGNFLLLENLVKKNCRNVYLLMKKQELSLADAKLIGQQMKKFHTKISTVKKNLRSRKVDLTWYNNYLYWRFETWDNKNLNTLVKQLKQEPKQLIYGDYNPKNMILDNQQLKTFDLETVHYGNTLFDIGFFAGHIILSFLNRPKKKIALIKAFTNGYGLTKNQISLGIKTSLATLLYRIKSSYNYETNFRFNKKLVLKRIDQLLINDNLTIDDLKKFYIF